MDVSILDLEPQCGTDDMESLDSSGSRIEHKHSSTSLVPHYLEYMGVPAYEYVRMITVYQLARPDIVSSRISAHMGHEDLHALALEEAVEGIFEAKGVVVTVARHSDQRLELRDFYSRFHAAAEITGMPDLVDRFKEGLDAIVEYTMCIGYETYVHGYNFMNIFFLYSITAISRWNSMYSIAKRKDMASLTPNTSE